MPENRKMRGRIVSVSKKLEDGITSAIGLYEEQHGLECCERSFDPEEIEQAAELLLSAETSEACICVDSALGFRSALCKEDYFQDCDHWTSRIHLRGNGMAFAIVLQKPGSCVDHRNVLIPRSDLLSKGKVALLQEAERGSASAMFTLSRLFNEGIGEPQNCEEAYFWHCVAMEFYEDRGDGEWTVDAAADNEALADKLPHALADEDSPLHKRVEEWVRAHREFLPDREKFEYDLDENDCNRARP